MYIKLKRIFDLIFSVVILISTSPILLCIGILVSMDGGKVFFKHKRQGKNGKIFHVYKFRTMVQDAENILSDVLKKDSKLAEEWKLSHKLIVDPRVTKIGKFLRKTKLDEIPQFYNVLKGEMTIVGPRPLTEEEFLHKFNDINNVKLYQSCLPGITGMWQVNSSQINNYAERIACEINYVKNINFKTDILIIIKTIKLIFQRATKNAD